MLTVLTMEGERERGREGEGGREGGRKVGTDGRTDGRMEGRMEGGREGGMERVQMKVFERHQYEFVFNTVPDRKPMESL